MGSPLGCLMGAFALDLVENKIDSYTGAKPLVHKHYVDDCFDVFNSQHECHEFLDFLNKQLPELKFTMEEENHGDITFLDVRVSRRNSFATSWHVKTTNTGLYLPYIAWCSMSYKISVAKALFQRAYSICSNYTAVVEAFDWIFNTLSRNGYPQKLLHKIASRIIENKQQAIIESKPKIFWSLPYLGHTDVLIREIKKMNTSLVNVSIFPVFRNLKTSALFKNKDPIPKSLLSNLVYEYSCDDCKMSYIGETTRHFGKRMQEHMTGHLSTEVYLHQQRHPGGMSNFKCVMKHKATDIAEALAINERSSENLLNAQKPSCLLLF